MTELEKHSKLKENKFLAATKKSQEKPYYNFTTATYDAFIKGRNTFSNPEIADVFSAVCKEVLKNKSAAFSDKFFSTVKGKEIVKVVSNLVHDAHKKADKFVESGTEKDFADLIDSVNNLRTKFSERIIKSNHEAFNESVVRLNSFSNLAWSLSEHFEPQFFRESKLWKEQLEKFDSEFKDVDKPTFVMKAEDYDNLFGLLEHEKSKDEREFMGGFKLVKSKDNTIRVDPNTFSSTQHFEERASPQIVPLLETNSHGWWHSHPSSSNGFSSGDIKSADLLKVPSMVFGELWTVKYKTNEPVTKKPYMRFYFKSKSYDVKRLD